MPITNYCVSYGQNLLLLHIRVGGRNSSSRYQHCCSTRRGAPSVILKGWAEMFRYFTDVECSETLVWNPSGISKLLFSLWREPPRSLMQLHRSDRAANKTKPHKLLTCSEVRFVIAITTTLGWVRQSHRAGGHSLGKGLWIASLLPLL